MSFTSTLAIIFIVPILIYAIFTALFGLKEPEKKLSFFAGVLLQKIGTTIGFTSLFYLGKDNIADHWLLYGFTWFVMFAFTEIGQTFMPNYSKKEAIAGIISEVIYFPLAAFVVATIAA